MNPRETDLKSANKRLYLLRKYDNKEEEVSKLSKFLSPIKKKMSSNKSKSLYFINDSLSKILPKTIHDSIIEISIIKGILYITSKNQTWKCQVEMFHKNTLLASLQASLPEDIKIRKISFK